MNTIHALPANTAQGDASDPRLALAPDPAPGSDLADEALVARFASAGLEVTVVEHCDDAGCPVCFDATPARAA